MMHKNKKKSIFFYNREINLNVCILMNRESWNSDFSWPLLVDQTDAVTPSSYPRRRSRHPSPLVSSRHTTTPERDGGAARPPHCRLRRTWRRRVSPEARCLPVRLLPRNGVPSWLLIANPPRFPSLPTFLVAKKALLPAAGCLLPAVAAAAYLLGSPTTSLYSPLAR